MEIGLVRHVDIQSEMEQSYLDYAMSVIVSRALPDARDGLKPVHRRILYAMQQMGLRPDTAFRKSARIVGEVLGKYHPHGDMAVYDAMARLAQAFSLRYRLVEGQGNFGSVDGDPPAAMRYTEARLSQMATDMLADIDQDTVDFEPNFDGSLREPVVLPSAIPNLLVNGATGIAVGMSTSIPPHNLEEVVDALILLLEQWDAREDVSLDELMERVQGPDFPTGGTILRGVREGEGMVAAYASGRGKIVVQARAHFEAMGRGRSRIIVTELPYQTNKANLIEKIAELARAGKLDGITDLRDETDREGMRIVIELAKGADPAKILGRLYKSTTMQSTFSMIMLALVDGQPRLLNLKQALTVYLEHRHEIVKRRSQHELAQKEARLHVLDGLLTALRQLDEVIETIRKSTDVPQARARLQKKFKLSEVQAVAILEMPLRRLASLERKKIETEHKETKARIKALKTLLGSDKALRALMVEELTEIRSRYGDRRRTIIVDDAEIDHSAPLTASDLAPSKPTWVVLSESGRLSRTATARLPRLSGRSTPLLVMGGNARDRLYLFDEDGNGGCLAVHTIPETDDPERGTPFHALCGLPSSSTPVSGVSVASEIFDREDVFLIFGTRKAMIKKSSIAELPPPSAQSFTAVKVNRGDRLGWTAVTSGTSELIMVSRQGMAIRFTEAEVRPMGLAAAGVNGMKLAASKDEVVSLVLVRPDQMAMLVARDGRAKRVKLSEFPAQGRYGKGVLAWPSGDEVEIVGASAGGDSDRATAVLSRQADRSVRLGDVPKRARTGAGVALFELASNDRVKSIRPVQPRGEAPPKANSRSAATKSAKRSRSRRSGTSKKPAGAKPTKARKSTRSAKSAPKGSGRKKPATKKKSKKS